MSKDRAGRDGRQQKSRLKRLLSTLAFVALVTAVVKELRTPKELRTWHGFLGGIVPYDLRPPTVDRLVERIWNPDGPLVSPQVFGVGWTLNAGAVVSRLRKAA